MKPFSPLNESGEFTNLLVWLAREWECQSFRRWPCTKKCAVPMYASPTSKRLARLGRCVCAVARLPMHNLRCFRIAPSLATSWSPAEACASMETVSVGPWRSWERASMASRRSWVRIPSAPPIYRCTVLRHPFPSIFAANVRKMQPSFPLLRGVHCQSNARSLG
jgi:hypothetical protein